MARSNITVACGRTANLIIEVAVGDQTQYSTVKSDVLTNSDSLTIWDEHMFFEFKGLVSFKHSRPFI